MGTRLAEPRFRPPITTKRVKKLGPLLGKATVIALLGGCNVLSPKGEHNDEQLADRHYLKTDLSTKTAKQPKDFAIYSPTVMGQFKVIYDTGVDIAGADA